MYKSIVPERDSIEFTYDRWTLHYKWASRVVAGCALEPQAHSYFWEMYREDILRELQPWLDQGYAVDGRVGAEQISVVLAEQYDVSADWLDVVMWIATFGLMFLFYLWGGGNHQIAVYHPVAFRVRLYCPDAPVRYDPDTVLNADRFARTR